MRTIGWIIGVILIALKLHESKSILGLSFFSVLFCLAISPLIYQVLALATGFGFNDISDLLVFLTISISLWLAIFIISSSTNDK